MIEFKWIKAMIVSLLLTANMLMAGGASAEVRTIEADGYYQMGDSMEENQAIAKERAKVDAMRRASEQVAVYIESNSEVSLGMLTKDEVRLLSAAILQVKSSQYRPMVVGDSIQYQCHIVAMVDTESVKGRIQNGRLELEENLRKYQEENERLRKEMEALKHRYKTASEEQKKQLQIEERKNNQDFLANQYFQQGNDLRIKKDYYGAIEAYSKAIALKSDYAEVYNNMGVTYYDLGQKEKSINLYEKAVALKPDDEEIYYNMGNTYFDLGQKEKAISLYEKAIALKANFTAAYYNMGNAYFYLGQKEKALSAYEKAIALNPNFADVYCSLGNIYSGLGLREKAISLYEKAIALNPNFAGAYYNIGNEFYYRGQKEKAISAFEKAVALNPNFAEAYNNMGVTYYDLGQKEKAKECYTKAYQLAPWNEKYRRMATGK